MAILNRLILFLIRRKFHLRNGQCFQFANQKSTAQYYITSTNVMKIFEGHHSKSNVSLNWLLDKGCQIVDPCITTSEFRPGLDSFGHALRDIRITEGLLLYDMAKDLGITSAELSAIECGRKPVPDWIFGRLQKLYHISRDYERSLRELANKRVKPIGTPPNQGFADYITKRFERVD